MSPQINDYNEIRQIIVDAIEPLKDQLREIAMSLKEEYARKDVLDPQLKSLQEEVSNLKQQVLSAPQRYLLYVCSIAGLVLTLLNIMTHFPK